jgi:hypothetical protein
MCSRRTGRAGATSQCWSVAFAAITVSLRSRVTVATPRTDLARCRLSGPERSCHGGGR